MQLRALIVKSILLSGICAAALAQQYTISTYAGTGTAGYSGDGGPAIKAQLSLTSSPNIAVDSAGNLYVGEYTYVSASSTYINCQVRRVSLSGIITTMVGTSTCGYSGDGGPAAGAQLNPPDSLAIDSSGNLYIGTGDNRVRKVSPSGIITTIAGTGSSGYSGDGGPATSARLDGPAGLAVDSSGNLYIADYWNFVIRKVSPSGVIATVAGNGNPGYSGDGGMATKAQFQFLEGLATDGAGNLYVADWGNEAVRKVTPAGVITTVASGAAFSGVATDGAGNLYLTDVGFFESLTGSSLRMFSLQSTYRVHMLSPAGVMSTIAGSGTGGYSGDGGPATSAQLGNNCYGVAVDSTGNIYVEDNDNKVIRLLKPAPTQLTMTIVSSASYAGGGLAPGEIVSIFGTNLGPSTGVPNTGYDPATGAMPTALGQVSVSFDGQPAPLFFVRNDQINIQVPYEVAGKASTSVMVTYRGVASAAVSVPVAAARPGIFQYNGRTLIVNAVTGAIIDGANPISRGDWVTIYGTGQGLVDPAIVTGKPASASQLSMLRSPQAKIGGRVIPVDFAGMTPGSVGLMQINLHVPSDAPTGSDVALELSVNGVTAQAYLGGAPTAALTIAIK